MRSTFCAAILVVSLAIADGASAQPSVNPGQLAASFRSPLLAANYVPITYSIGLFEVRSANLALARSKSKPLRDFAQLLITDQTALNNSLGVNLAYAGLTLPPPALTPQHDAMLRQLEGASRNFDEVFRNVQVTMHLQALSLNDAYARDGDSPQLRSYAANQASLLVRRVSQLRALATQAVLPTPKRLAGK